MTSVKVFKIKGVYKSGKREITFGKEIRALNKEDALEELYSILGSKHHVKRNLIKIKPKDIKVIANPDEIKDFVVKTFTTEDDLKIPFKK